MPFLLLMPSYNQAHYIVDAVRSVLAQDDPDWELWILDNSSDGTPAAMAQFTDPRIHFHHIAARMDPGTCLNWLLERVDGRDFSYVHTDNNLHPAYVRRMRAALAEDPLALAYCDMRTIDAAGRYVNVYRRGEFDLPRLLSVDSLGVPFSATVALAREVGGFSARDFADDVRFCVAAYGLAHYVYVPEALIDYRLHGQSRTEAAGGGDGMQQVFAQQMPKLVALLEQRGVPATRRLEAAIRAGFDDVDLTMEDIWYRKFARRMAPWWQGVPSAEHFFANGLLNFKEFTAGRSAPRMVWRPRTAAATHFIAPWSLLGLRFYLFGQRRRFRAPLKRTRHLVFTWAALQVPIQSSGPTAFRVRALDFRTLWIARQLEVYLGWQPHIDASVAIVPAWLGWPRATGSEPLLDSTAIQK